MTEMSVIPDPKGYKVLVVVPRAEEKTAGGIFKPDKLVDAESIATIYGAVAKMGPDAYKDKKKFPNGAYCEVGDFVLFRSYTGTRFKIDGTEYRLINDDAVEAVVEDPRKIERV